MRQAVPPFRTISTSSDSLNRVQANVLEFSAGLVASPIVQGQLLEDIELSTTATKVDHKLSRAYKGWFIVDKNATADVWVSEVDLPQRYITLISDSTVTVSLWVF